MKISPSRRMFLRNSAILSSGIALLPSTSFASSFRISKSPYDGYNPYAKEISDLRKSTFHGKHLTVKGTVYDGSGSFPLSNVTVEVWHLSPNSNKYQHRAKLITNNNGEYNFVTDFPNNEKSKIPRIYFKVSNENNELFTELFINDFGANITGQHWEKNKQLGEKLFPLKKGSLNASSITFNISI